MSEPNFRAPIARDRHSSFDVSLTSARKKLASVLDEILERESKCQVFIDSLTDPTNNSDDI